MSKAHGNFLEKLQNLKGRRFRQFEPNWYFSDESSPELTCTLNELFLMKSWPLTETHIKNTQYILYIYILYIYFIYIYIYNICIFLQIVSCCVTVVSFELQLLQQCLTGIWTSRQFLSLVWTFFLCDCCFVWIAVKYRLAWILFLSSGCWSSRQRLSSLLFGLL